MSSSVIFILLLLAVGCLPYDDGQYHPERYGYDDGQYRRPAHEGKYVPGFEGKYIPGYEGHYIPGDEGEYADNGDYRYVHQEGPMGGFGEGKYQPELYSSDGGSYNHQYSKYVHQVGPSGGSGGYGGFGGNGSYGGVGGLGPNGPLGPTGPFGARGRGVSAVSYQYASKDGFESGRDVKNNGKYIESRQKDGIYSIGDGSYKHEYVYREGPSGRNRTFGGSGGFTPNGKNGSSGPSGPSALPGREGSAPTYQDGPQAGFGGGKDVNDNGIYNGPLKDEGKFQSKFPGRGGESYKHQYSEYVHREKASGKSEIHGSSEGLGPKRPKEPVSPSGPSGPPGGRGSAPSYQHGTKGGFGGDRDVSGNGRYNGFRNNEGKYQLGFYPKADGRNKHLDREYVQQRKSNGGTGGYSVFASNERYGDVGVLGLNGYRGPLDPSIPSGPPGRVGSVPPYQDGPKEEFGGGRYTGRHEEKYHPGFYSRGHGSYIQQDSKYLHHGESIVRTGGYGAIVGNGSYGGLGGFDLNGPKSFSGLTGSSKPLESNSSPGREESGAPRFQKPYERSSLSGSSGPPETLRFNSSPSSDNILKIPNTNLLKVSKPKDSFRPTSRSQSPGPGGPILKKPVGSSGSLGLSRSPNGSPNFFRSTQLSGGKDVYSPYGLLEPGVSPSFPNLPRPFGSGGPSGPKTFSARVGTVLFNPTRGTGTPVVPDPPALSGSGSSSSSPRPFGSLRRGSSSVISAPSGSAASGSPTSLHSDSLRLSGVTEYGNAPSDTAGQLKYDSNPPPFGLLVPPSTLSHPVKPSSTSRLHGPGRSSITPDVLEPSLSRPSNKSKNFIGPAYLPAF